MAKAVNNKKQPAKRSGTSRSARPEAKNGKEKAKAPGKLSRALAGAEKKPGAGKQGRSGRGSRQTAKRDQRGLNKFVRDVRVEMGKVTWPTRKDLVVSTIVVIIAVAISAAYVGVLDAAFQRIINFILP